MNGSGRFAGYSLQAFQRDLVAGFIVGVVAIPLAMSFAIASGVKPQYGMYTTIIAGFLISLLGGSKFQIGGPTGAFVPILLGVVLQYGYENLLLAGMMAGVILILMGIFKLGVLIQFIPKPVTIGFTTGIAVIIFSGQIANFLGLREMKSHEDFLSNMKEIGMHLSTTNIYSVITALISLAVLIALPRVYPKIPASLVGLVISSLTAALWFSGKVATIGSTYGAVPSALPAFTMPHVSMEQITMLLPPALVIAMLGGIESLLSAVVADGMGGTRHRSNKELIGQGVANIITPLFGGIPATGAIARTATNIKSGAASPLSGMIHAGTVLIVLIVFAPFASAIPLSSMAPILMVVAWNMSERKEFVHLLRTKTSDSVILVITFLLTVFTNLTTAVVVGLLLAVIVFVKRMRDTTSVTSMVKEGLGCPQINILTLEGPLFFGAAHRIETSIMDSLRSHHGSLSGDSCFVGQTPRVLLLHMGKVPFLDATGESNLAGIVKHVASSGGRILISGIQPQPKAFLQKTGLYERIGQHHFFDHTSGAIVFSMNQLDLNRCLGCKQQAFHECSTLATLASFGDVKSER
ncbi:SulP family inorganic anion transporter [Paenibacillus cremeus]|uniref:STAS domain-containing protein n=1 Tax=Paenibacillus cremeus TaxID=2163881 RepID=A0A559JPW1_9BACL|nr:SulP family inorganic anion transporter [Paenibacillus cremeus]TVY01900.1 STAS domain-containing protein [Paenibacillus cremeus]